MIKINISKIEKQRLIQLACRDLKSSRGSSDYIVPEFTILINKLKDSTDCIELSPIEFEIISNWIYDGITASRLRNPNDNNMIGTLYDQIYQSYKELKNEYLYRIKIIQDNLNLIAKFIGKGEIKDVDFFKPVQIKLSEENVEKEPDCSNN